MQVTKKEQIKKQFLVRYSHHGNCLRTIGNIRWQGDIRCIKCNVMKYKLKTKRTRDALALKFYCSNCDLHFNETSGSSLQYITNLTPLFLTLYAQIHDSVTRASVIAKKYNLEVSSVMNSINLIQKAKKEKCPIFFELYRYIFYYQGYLHATPQLASEA